MNILTSEKDLEEMALAVFTGAKVYRATDAQDFLERAKKREYDMIIAREELINAINIPPTQATLIWSYQDQN